MQGGTSMGLFGKKEKVSPPSAAKSLSKPATIMLTCNAIPSNKKATYWFDVKLNNETVGRIEQNDHPATFVTMVDKNKLWMDLCIKENNGNITKYPTSTQMLELTDGETVKVLFEKRKFTVESV